MSTFEIDIQELQSVGLDEPHAVAIRADGKTFTRLMRPGVDGTDDYLRAPPAQLAFWFVDNWWRLRWEPITPGRVSAEWRLAHELSSIGGGYVWPRFSIWGEGARTGISCRSDPSGVVGPVRYVTDALMFIPAESFEQAIDDFLRMAVDAQFKEREALRSQRDALMKERRDAEMTAWRRLEAHLGFDPDTAPDELMEAMGCLVARYGTSGVEEAALAVQGKKAAETLELEISAARKSHLSCKLGEAVKAAGNISRSPETPPWNAAEGAASNIRSKLGILPGPLRNKKLGELLNVPSEVFRKTEPNPTLSYGLRLKRDNNQLDAIASRAKWSDGRRFELCRALGDAIWSRYDALGPLTNSMTARQKFQRAFAQSLLCPFDDLIAYIDTDEPTESDVFAAAKHFHVSERVIQSTLVNKRVIDHERFGELVEEA